MTQWTTGAVTTSTAVTTTAMSPSGTPSFVVRTQYGYQATQPVVVLTGGGSTTVTVVAFSTASDPNY